MDQNPSGTQPQSTGDIFAQDAAPPQQQQSLGDLNVPGNDNLINVVQGRIVTLTQNKIIQVSVDEIKTRKFIKTSPYKSLKSFQREDKDRFFGRHQFLTVLADELEQSNLVLLLGASGSGKSSVVRAGLIPGLLEKWGNQFVGLTLTPDLDPFRSLSSSLISRGFGQSVAMTVEAGEEDALTQLVTTTKQPESFWFIFIDQFEELFTRSVPGKRDRFIKAIAKLCRDCAGDPMLKVMATMRSDFLDKLDAAPANELASLTEKHRPLITQMHPDELRLAIEQPAAYHGVVFEEGLVERIIQEVQGQAGYLPLMQYTLDLLWKMESELEEKDGGLDDRTLNISSYDAIGGVRGALQKRVNQIYLGLSAEERTAMQCIFLRLVGVGGDVATETDWRPIRKRELRSRFTDPLEEKVLVQLINANLLVSGAPEDGSQSGATVEIAHEVLLTSWYRLEQWITENREAIALRNRLNEDVAQWKDSGLDDELWGGVKLAKAVELRDDSTFNQVLDGFDPDATRFLAASVGRRDAQEREEKERQQKELRRAKQQRRAALVVGVVMAGLAVFSGLKIREAEIQQIQTSIALSDISLAEGKHLDADVESTRAAAILTKSWWRATMPSHLSASVSEQLYQTVFVGHELNRLEGHDGNVSDVASWDGKRLVTAGEDGTARLWSSSGEQLEVFKGHDGGIWSVAISPNGERIATAGEDRTARLWSSSGEQLAVLRGHDALVSSVAFSPNGEHLVTRGLDGTARLWSSSSGEQLEVLDGHDRDVWSVEFSPDGERLATGGVSGTVRLWSSSGERLASLKGHDRGVTSVAFSPDGERLATSGEDGTVRLWSSSSGEQLEVLDGHDRITVWSVEFSPDGERLVTRGWDGRVQLWSSGGKPLTVLEDYDAVLEDYYDDALIVRFSPDGELLATGGRDGTVRLWSSSGEQLAVLESHNEDVSSVEFSPDGERLATGGKDGIVRLWSSSSSDKQLAVLKGHELDVLSVAFSPDGERLATGGRDGTVRLWSSSGEQPAVLKGHDEDVWSVAFSPDGERFVSGGRDGTVRLWSSSSGEQLKVLEGHEIAGYDKDVYSVGFSPDGERLVTGGEDGTVRLWSSSSGEQLEVLEGHDEAVYSVEFSPDGERFVSGGWDGTVQLWSSGGEQLEVLRHGDSVRSVGFSPDGEHLATSGWDGKVQLWSSSGERLTPLTGHRRRVYSVAFSPDGERLATGGEDGTARLWSSSGEQLAVFQGHDRKVYSVAFSPDGERLATGGEDRAARLWPVESIDKLLVRQCNWVRDYLENNAPQSDRHLCDGIGTD